MKKAAIIYHYIALYRLPIFQELMKSDLVEYSIYSGKTSDINIEKIDEALSTRSIDDGGLRWSFFKNKWVFKKQILWQHGVINLVLKNNHDSYIFLGSPYHISTWIAALIARFQRKKVYFWMHGVYKDKLGLIDYVKLYVFYKIAHGFFLYGNRSKSIINYHRIKRPENIHVIYNSLDYKKCINYRKHFNLSGIHEFRLKYFNETNVPVIVFIGRLNKIKRIDMLLKAQSILKIKYNKIFFNLLIIGDGSEKNSLINLALDLELINNVVFLGAIYEEKINSYCLMNSDLCVTPGEVGLTAIHSLSYGTPVISHNNLDIQMPEVEAIVSGISGDLYKYNEIQSLVDTIDKWLTDNPSKNEKVMQQCFDIIDSYYNPVYQSKIFNSVLK